ncbi:flagellin [Halalkaliarchaeum desulfuricum]|uniref:Flagellin n=1 Tax=Halalkaliarchaeum desulfuricum TaxID=2055893 RepID=A0A343TN74_9EURY|nr:type IV pilin N-terminal domain-containing protein [Halalkaliarchaeum desulfuricum]AUX10546.1 flagellin [Halalkaliarchaeum desulfuricum]
MQLKAFFEDREAVSPVIGVILMVAITEILAAVIGTFVLGLGDQVGETAPNANWGTDVNEDETEVTFTHNGGDSVDKDELRFTVSGDVSLEDADDHGDGGELKEAVDTPLTAGSSITAVVSVDNDDDTGTVTLVWESGDQSSVLKSVDVDPDA